MLKRLIKSISSRIKHVESVNSPDDANSVYISKVPELGIKYIERSEIGPKNLEIKMKRKKEGGPFEWPNIVALNKAIVDFVKDSKLIANIGSGTGTFEWYASKKYPNSKFIASEFDLDCVKWCKTNRQRENITYTNQSIDELLKKYKKFDIVFCVEVIEHIYEYSNFLRDISKLSDKFVFTTPNKDRSVSSALTSPPEYYQHVREWDAGEFYWILKCFFKKVKLYSIYAKSIQT